ncbi:MAG TPA: hypothetical protein VGM79_17040 [Streptosporangiaceae bacterium]
MWAAIGTSVMGRHFFDLMNGWEGRPPAGDHVVVLSHRPKPAGWHPEASYHFVDDVTAAVAKARDLAGERTVIVNAGEAGGQVLAAGLVDEVAMDVVPVVFGSGKRYFGSIDGQHLLEDPHVIQGDRVLHLRFRSAARCPRTSRAWRTGRSPPSWSPSTRGRSRTASGGDLSLPQMGRSVMSGGYSSGYIERG